LIAKNANYELFFLINDISTRLQMQLPKSKLIFLYRLFGVYFLVLNFIFRFDDPLNKKIDYSEDQYDFLSLKQL